MSFEMKGFKEYEKLLKKAQKNIKLVHIATLKDVMKLMYDIAYRECPQGETGFLKSSINYNIQMDSDGKEVGEFRVDAPYATYVNSGTSTQRAQPFFTRAVIAGKIALLKIAGVNLKKAMSGQDVTANGPDSQGQRIKTPRKYLYQTRAKGGARRYVYSKQRAGTIKFRGKQYRGRNFAAQFESA